MPRTGDILGYARVSTADQDLSGQDHDCGRCTKQPVDDPADPDHHWRMERRDDRKFTAPCDQFARIVHRSRKHHDRQQYRQQQRKSENADGAVARAEIILIGHADGGPGIGL